MNIVIVSGGRLEQSALAFFEKRQIVIAVDGGLKFCYENHIALDYIVGDFDTIESEILEYYKEQSTAEIVSYPPEKDVTDTKAALQLAVKLAKDFADTHAEKTEILLFGGIGSRMDHTLANVGCLMYALEHGVSMKMIDSHNCMYVYNQSFIVEKKNLVYQNYLSLIALKRKISNLTIRGAKYQVKDITLPVLSDWGVSNELLEEKAEIAFEDGILLVIESRD